MADEVTLEMVYDKEDVIIEKLEDLLELMTLYDSKLTDIDSKLTGIDSKVIEVLTKVNGLLPPSEASDDDEEETTGEFRAELEAKINEGLPYDQVKEWIISKLEELGLYSEEDMVIKIFVHRTGDMILEFKVRPYSRWGDAIQFFQSNMGDTDYFETSRYTMKNIMWWRLNKNMQMEEQTSDSSIIDNVTEDWGDNDNVNQHIGQGK